MKKEETSKVKFMKDRGILKNGTKIQGEKFNSQKPFLGCGTCRLKQVVPLKKNRTVQENDERFKKNFVNNSNVKRTKITFTDLCDEDKKKVIELLEELTKFAQKNRILKECLDFSEKSKQEQHNCLVKQTNLHLEEKNMFLKEIQACKARLELYEEEMKDKIFKWGARERLMNNEIQCLVKALQKSFFEKSDLMKEIKNLKTCLKQSLESFELLRSEVAAIQKESADTIKSNASSIQLVANEKGDEETSKQVEESEDEYLSATKELPSRKLNFELINDKLEQLYALFKNKAFPPPPEKVNHEKIRIEKEVKTEPELIQVQNPINLYPIEEDVREKTSNDSNYKFLKPFNKFSKNSIQVEGLLKNIEKTFLGGCEEKVEDFEAKRVDHFNEDRLLSELFYSDKILDLELESAFLLADKNHHRYHHH